MKGKSFLLFTLALLVLTVSFSIVFADTSKAKNKSVDITNIEADTLITGTVTGIGNPGNYKVIVYVHTDMWYIHPFVESAAPISGNSWSIETVQRGHTANKIAVLVVDNDVAKKAPAKTTNINKIKHLAIKIYTRQQMEGNEWYGRL